jgi:hypothetical protein
MEVDSHQGAASSVSSRGDLKPGMTVLARTSSNSNDKSTVGRHFEDEAPRAYLGENTNLGPGSRRYLKPRITLLARASSDLAD